MTDDSSHAVSRWFFDNEDLLLLLAVVPVVAVHGVEAWALISDFTAPWYLGYLAPGLTVFWIAWFITWAIKGGMPPRYGGFSR